MLPTGPPNHALVENTDLSELVQYREVLLHENDEIIVDLNYLVM